MKSFLIISLDFELFWGVSESKSIKEYGQNILAVYDVIPALLKLFKTYEIRTTWATVGMLMCRDYNQWKEIQPAQKPTYINEKCSNYNLEKIIQKNPKLFFAPELISLIKDNQQHEIASHTYSHFYCNENGINIHQFKEDLKCSELIAKTHDLTIESIIFPRNQINEEYLPLLKEFGIKCFRGNNQNWLYRNGNNVAGGKLGQFIRLMDSYFPLSGNLTGNLELNENLLNIPASIFLRPISKFRQIEEMRISRIINSMTYAAQQNKIFHLWWHPHNFGVNMDLNLAFLERILKHYHTLNIHYGMESKTMYELYKNINL